MSDNQCTGIKPDGERCTNEVAKNRKNVCNTCYSRELKQRQQQSGATAETTTEATAVDQFGALVKAQQKRNRQLKQLITTTTENNKLQQQAEQLLGYSLDNIDATVAFNSTDNNGGNSDDNSVQQSATIAELNSRIEQLEQQSVEQSKRIAELNSTREQQAATIQRMREQSKEQPAEQAPTGLLEDHKELQEQHANLQADFEQLQQNQGDDAAAKLATQLKSTKAMLKISKEGEKKKAAAIDGWKKQYEEQEELVASLAAEVERLKSPQPIKRTTAASTSGPDRPRRPKPIAQATTAEPDDE